MGEITEPIPLEITVEMKATMEIMEMAEIRLVNWR